MAVYVDSDSRLHRDEPDAHAECPACGEARVMPVAAAPNFGELVARRPAQVGVALQCPACGHPVFLRYRTRGFGPDRVELQAPGSPVERSPERFALSYLPEPVAEAFREALACYAHDLHRAFAMMCRLTARATFADLGERGKLALFDQVSEVRELAGFDEPTFTAVRRVLFDSDLERAGLPPAIDAAEAAALLETMKDALYQLYVRGAKLRKALEMRRHFAAAGEERDTAEPPEAQAHHSAR